MDSFEWNKIAGAVLGTLTFTLALGIFSEIIFSSPSPAKPGYEIAVPDAPAHGGGGAEPPAPAKPIAELLASASPERGADDVKKCQSCHSFEKGGPNKVGPNLFGIVGAPRAHLPNFAYSQALRAAGGTWTFENLSHFIENPKAAIPGTAMAFAGVKREGERADILAFLNKNSDNPQPLPTVTAAPAAPEAGATAPAGTTPAAADPHAAPGAAPHAPAAGQAPAGAQRPAGQSSGQPAAGQSPQGQAPSAAAPPASQQGTTATGSAPSAGQAPTQAGEGARHQDATTPAPDARPPAADSVR